jgi:GNAT superfamily N-acetyltransferase
MAIAMREARRGEELAVAELHIRSWQEAYRGLMPTEFLDALDPRQRAGRYTFEASGAGAPTTVLAVVGEEGGEGDPSLTNCGEVRSDPDRHRGGVGRLLMAEARHRLRKSGVTESILWVLIGNDRAARFYEGEGWIPDGATREERPYDIVSNVRRFRRALG